MSLSKLRLFVHSVGVFGDCATNDAAGRKEGYQAVKRHCGRTDGRTDGRADLRAEGGRGTATPTLPNYPSLVNAFSMF